jgi:outer membrane murein-binding lipoprotein Lpp
MGSSHSVYTSRPKDTPKNLLWALEQSLKWEDAVVEAKKLLSDPEADGERAKFGGLDLVMFEMDETRRLLLHCKDILLSNPTGKKRSKKYLSELEKDKVSMHAEAAMGKSASELFAEGAAVKVATDETVTNPILSVQHDKGHNNTGNPFEETKSNFSSAFIDKADYSPEKKSLLAEYLFIHNLVEKCILNCQFCYKLHTRAANLSHNLSKNKKNWAPSRVENMTAEQQRTEKLLIESLANFDRAYETLMWADRDYELSLGLNKLQQQVARLNKCSSAVHSFDSTGKGPLTLQIDELMNDLNKVKGQFYAAVHQNDRDAIDLGFNYLDSDDNSKLSPNDLAGMSPRIVQLLKITDKKQLKIKQLHSTFDKQTKIITELVEKTKTLEMKTAELKVERNPKNDAMIEKHSQEISELNSKTMQASDDLHELYSFFLQAFARHVFAELNTEDVQTASSKSLDMQQINAGLSALEISQQTDPLNQTLATENAVRELTKQDPQELASAHAKEFHAPNPQPVFDKETPTYT